MACESSPSTPSWNSGTKNFGICDVEDRGRGHDNIECRSGFRYPGDRPPRPRFAIVTETGQALASLYISATRAGALRTRITRRDCHAESRGKRSRYARLRRRSVGADDPQALLDPRWNL